MEEERSESSRYRLILKIASGGMATVWVGAVRGGLGFRQLVAIKKPHPHLFELPSLRDELVSEARLASMIQHGNVVDVRDVDVDGDQINLVMDYIEGGSLADLMRAAKQEGNPLPPRVVLRIILDSCAGLHAAHELADETGRLVDLVHRDVSPQNILVGLDGISRVTDFGIAKVTRSEVTDAGLVKGKLSYMSPEYIANKGCDRRLDVFALGTVCWEALAGERCFKGETDLDTANRIIRSPARPLSEVAPQLGRSLDDVLATAMARQPNRRFPTARAFASALETAGAAVKVGTHAEVAACVAALVGKELEERRATVRAALSRDPATSSLPVATPRAAEVRSTDSKSSKSIPLPSDSSFIPLPSDSRSSQPVALSSGSLEAGDVASPSGDISADALRPPVRSRRRLLALVVAGVCGAALFVVLIAAALSSRTSPPVAARRPPPEPEASVALATTTPGRVNEPIPDVDVELPVTKLSPPDSATSSVAVRPPVAPPVPPRPTAVRAPTVPSSSVRTKPVPPNPYGH